jgi:hypothetical protein
MKRCGAVLLGAWVAACGPVPGDESSADETSQEARVADDVVGQGAEEEARGELAPPLAPPRSLALGGPAVAYGGGKSLTVWRDLRAGGLWGMRMKADGTLLDAEGFRINIGDAEGGTPAVAYNGKHFVVVWETSEGILGVRVRTDGRVLGPVFTVVASDEVEDPSIACSRKVCLVAYTVVGDDTSTIGLRRVTPEGTVLRPESRYRFLGDPDAAATESSVAWSGKEFLVVWSDSRGGTATPDIYGGRVRESGSIVGDTEGFAISTAPGAQRSPDVAWMGRRFLTAWEDDRSGDFRIWGARVRQDATVDDPSGFRISPTTGRAFNPAVAPHGSKTLVVWGAGFSGAAFIGAARVTQEGTVRDPAGFAVSTGSYDANFLPDAAYGGGLFLTTYVGGVDTDFPPFRIVGSRVTRHTDVLDEQVLTRSHTAPPPRP